MAMETVLARGANRPAQAEGKLTVLVVDDSALQRRIVAGNLHKWGFAVVEAAGGEEALAICRSREIDLVISDWMMPGMDGLEFCRRFREMPRERYGYFILLTSRSEKNDVATGLDVGADDFLSKPVNSAELKARVRAGTRVLDMEQKLIDQNETVQSALDELQMLYDSLSRDLAEAAKFQQSLVPARHAEVPGGEISILYQCSSHVGGDLVGHFSFEPSRLGLYSIDVSGHGVSSALLTARIAGFLNPHDRAQNVAFAAGPEGGLVPRDPGEVAAVLNARMCREMDTDHYFTMCYADIDLATGRARMVQAGHPHPVLLRAGGEILTVGTGGAPIGLLPDFTYESEELELAPGDRLLLHSDGLTECQGSNGEQLEEEGLRRILGRIEGGSGPEFMADLAWELSSFAGSSSFEDDVSAILYSYRGPPSD